MDRNLDKRLRKPRQTRGTPLHRTRHYYFFGMLGVSSLFLILFEMLPGTAKLKEKLKDNPYRIQFIKENIERQRLGQGDPTLEIVYTKVKKKLEEKEKQKEEEPRPQSSLSKIASVFQKF